MKGFAKLAVVALVSALVAGCGGGSNVPALNAPNPTPAATSSAPTPTTQVATQFTIAAPSSTTAARLRPQYVTASVKSVVITLDTVNGSAPPAGRPASVTDNVTITSCPCVVAGPSVPPGTDTFTLTTYDNTNATGNAISTASPTLSITQGAANDNVITLEGIPHSFSVAAVPSVYAGTPFTSPQAFTVAVKDADGDTIAGSYANPVTITDSDTSSLTLGTALAVNGGTGSTTVKSTASTDVITLNYGGLAIPPATITASASGATNGSATFAPYLGPIAYSGPLSGSSPEIDLYATSGTGSSATFTATEIGWTNPPYNRAITATEAAGCSSIATTSPSSGTSFVTTVAASPAVGTCTMTLSDFSGGSTKNVTLTYTTSGLGVI